MTRFLSTRTIVKCEPKYIFNDNLYIFNDTYITLMIAYITSMIIILL